VEERFPGVRAGEVAAMTETAAEQLARRGREARERLERAGALPRDLDPSPPPSPAPETIPARHWNETDKDEETP
jgi:endonuclease YncB( thermonuclease family)